MIFESVKKDTGKAVLLQVKDLKQIIVKFRAENILHTFLFGTKHPFEVHKILSMKAVV